MKKFFVLSFFVFCSMLATAQQDPHFTQYMFNMMSINPAYVGNKDYVHTSLLYRNQWVRITGAPVTQALGISAPINSNRIGVGASIINTSIGASNLFSARGVYNYRIQTSKTGTFSMGLYAGVVQFQVDPNKLITFDPISTDPVYAGAMNRLVPDFGTGFYFQEKKYSIGLSIPHLLQTKVKFNNGVPVAGGPERNKFAKFSRHYYLNGMYTIEANHNLDVIPSTLIKYVYGARPEVDFNLNMLFHDFMWGGASYRTGDAIALLTGFYLEKKIRKVAKHILRFGYSYDLTTSRLRSFSNGSHEIMLSYDYLIFPAVRCPNPDRRAY